MIAAVALRAFALSVDRSVLADVACSWANQLEGRMGPGGLYASPRAALEAMLRSARGDIAAARLAGCNRRRVVVLALLLRALAREVSR